MLANAQTANNEASMLTLVSRRNARNAATLQVALVCAFALEMVSAPIDLVGGLRKTLRRPSTGTPK
jgi:hypothetical protein